MKGTRPEPISSGRSLKIAINGRARLGKSDGLIPPNQWSIMNQTTNGDVALRGLYHQLLLRDQKDWVRGRR